MNRKMFLPVFALVLFPFIAERALPKAADQIHVSVHEWGTFTSVAGQNGEPVVWRTYSNPAELPCFVEWFGGFKRDIAGTVRMETPVLYFYSSRELSANVKVSFPRGTVTEWYPKATLNNSYNVIEWSNVKVSPIAAAEFPVGKESHYYTARETDSAPLLVGSQKEKFLFYRGVGSFPLPLSATLMEDGRVRVKNVGGDPVGGVILFENRGGDRRYAFVGSVRDEITLDPRSLHGNSAGVLADLKHVLVEQGLYEREAQAMVETWRDSWFEEGTRLFYIVPRPAIDGILPLEIQPAPSDIARVFVGRMELITPTIEKEVREAIARNDRGTLEKYGRFLDPIAARAGIKSALLDSIASKYTNFNRGCSR